MALLVCKMCSAPLEVTEDQTLARCSYCGAVYTMPLEDLSEETVAAKAELLMKRARMFLEDGLFNSAGEYFEKTLDVIPSLGEAYLGKGLSELGVRTIPELVKLRREARRNYYIKKALVFCKEPMLSALKEALGLRGRSLDKDAAANKWRTKTAAVRKEFVQEIRRHLTKDSPEYDVELREIEGKYAPKTASIRRLIHECDEQIAARKEVDLSAVTINDLETAADKVEAVNLEKSKYLRELLAIDDRRSTEIAALKKKYPHRKDRIGLDEYLAVARDYPIPPMYAETTRGIIDRVYDYILGSYEFRTKDEITAYFGEKGVNAKRTEAALNKLLYDRRIFEMEVGGINGYACADLIGVEVD